ncbi:MAG: DNA-binding protein [Robiginitomaculum sp.]|nr:MAG: DNA-binding protein [Robiginitomaculum sp.]
MHKADIKAALEKKGMSLSALEKRYKLPVGSVSETLRRGRPSIENIIADTLNTTPQELFPDRFNKDGQRKYKHRGRPQKESH